MGDPRDLLFQSKTLHGSGELIAVTPEAAGWEYTGLTVQRLAPGDAIARETGEDEVGLVLLGGRVRVESGGETWEIGERRTPFDGQPGGLYLPRRTAYTVTAVDHVELAICTTRAEEDFPVLEIRPEDVAVEIRGAGNAARQINHIVAPGFPAHRLLIVEVFTPSGNWSSFPPHKHDVSNLPAESDLEEIYYYRINPADGFGLQRLYTDDGRIDEAYVIHDGSLLLVPEGYHAFAVAHGYTGYYLNVLAGNEPVRTMQPSDDPAYAWVRASWTEAMNEGAKSWREIDARVNNGAGWRD